MKDKIRIEDDYRIAFLSSEQGRRVLLDIIARSKILSGSLTETDIPVANFVTTILNRCGLFGCVEEKGGIHYHESLGFLIEKLQSLPYEGAK